MSARRLIGTAAVGIIGLLIGLGAGQSAATPSTPPACVTALARADDVIDVASQALTLGSSAFRSVSQFDTDALDRDVVKMNALAPKASAARAAYDEARKGCQ